MVVTDSITPMLEAFNEIEIFRNTPKNAKLIRGVFIIGLHSLEGQDVTEEFKDLLKVCEIEIPKLTNLCHLASIMVWTHSLSCLEGKIAKIEFKSDPNLADTVMETFENISKDYHKSVLRLTETMGPPAYSYANLAWRLEAELGKRSMLVANNFMYAMRLDIIDHSKSRFSDSNNSISDSNGYRNDYSNLYEHALIALGESGETDPKRKQIHLRCNYANLVHLQDELERANKSIDTVNSRRLMKYIT